ncbi:MAG: AMP-binding protein, partial [Anaerolineae bacterium]|nr:AMP-binding protein [Anaerolineae bacterium]
MTYFGTSAAFISACMKAGIHPNEHYDLSRIRAVGSTGSPLSAEGFRWVYQNLNSTLALESLSGGTDVCTAFVGGVRVQPIYLGEIQGAALGASVQALDESGNPVIDEVGELVISGPNVTPGYWKRPDADQSSFTIDEYGNRWLHSGDAAMIDEDGCIYIVDRYKDMYISGGENVYPAEVEQVIFHLDGVADVAVIGVPDAKWGETGKAIVVVKPESKITEAEIIEHCKRNLARYKVPASVAFIEVLPRNAAGKVLKRELRQKYLSEGKQQ